MLGLLTGELTQNVKQIKKVIDSQLKMAQQKFNMK
jgi:hypothetical protein